MIKLLRYFGHERAKTRHNITFFTTSECFRTASKSFRSKTKSFRSCFALTKKARAKQGSGKMSDCELKKEWKIIKVISIHTTFLWSLMLCTYFCWIDSIPHSNSPSQSTLMLSVILPFVSRSKGEQERKDFVLERKDLLAVRKHSLVVKNVIIWHLTLFLFHL